MPYMMKNLHLRLTSRCNKNCKHCFAALESNSVDLPLEYWIGIIDSAMQLGLQNVTLTGGEPFVYKDIAALLAYVKELPCTYSIETNGILLKSHLNDLIGSKNIRKIAISPDIEYDENEIRKLLDNCYMLMQNNINVLVQTVLLPQNLDKALVWLGVFEREKIPCRVMIGHNKLGRSKYLTENFTLKSILEVYRRLQNFSCVQCNLPPLITGSKDNFACGWNTHRADIMPNGEFTTCATIAWNDSSFLLGKVDRTNLAEMWYNNPSLNKWRSLKAEDFKGKCNNCVFFKQCKGSCVAVTLGYKGNILDGYPMCEEFCAKQ